MQEKVHLTIKSDDTEEWLDTVWTRPIGYLWAVFFQRLNIHPNTVTILSMIIGAGSAYFFASGSYRIDGLHGLIFNIIGVLLLAWANFYDSADGQLARMTGKKTQLGRILDGAAGDVWYIFIYNALIVRMYLYHDMEFGWLGIENTERNTIIYVVIMYSFIVLDGLGCHAGQCALSDYYRQIHLLFLKGKAGSELDTYSQQKINYDSTPWKGNFIKKVFLFFYTKWTRSQERRTPQFQKLFSLLKSRYSSIENVPQSFRDEFRSQSLPMMKWTNILTFNTRAIALYVACLTDLPWLVLAFEIIVLSAILMHMHHTHEGFCKKLYEKLNNEVQQ